MQRAAPGLLADLEPLIAAAAIRDPQWRMVMEPLREIARALPAAEWAAAAAGAELQPARPVDAPILAGAVIPAPADALSRLLAKLGAESDRRGAVALIEESIGHAGGAIASLAAMPLLYACARAHADRVPAHWPFGYCPVCGTWAAIAELVGVDRARHLRCGRCAADWIFSWLACPYCGERDHGQLESLVPEASRDSRKIEACTSCGGYLKSVTTLGPSQPIELFLRDLETLELDLAALEHGYTRPAEPGYALDARLTAC